MQAGPCHAVKLADSEFPVSDRLHGSTFLSAVPLCIAMWSVLSLAISYCGWAGLAWWVTVLFSQTLGDSADQWPLCRRWRAIVELFDNKPILGTGIGQVPKPVHEVTPW